MYDLIGSYERINRIYRMYIESAFPLRYNILNEERRAILSNPGILSQPPLVETTPVYPLSSYTLADASEQLVKHNLAPEYRDLQF